MKQMPDSVRAALKEVLDYSWDSELSHFEEHIADGEDTSGHVFVKLVELDNWLNNRKETPESYVDESLKELTFKRVSPNKRKK